MDELSLFYPCINAKKIYNNLEKFNGWESEEWRKYWGVDDYNAAEDDPNYDSEN